MDSKVSVTCNTEKSIDKFSNKFRECNECNIRRSLKSYYETRHKISNQQKKYYEQNRDKLIQKQNNR